MTLDEKFDKRDAFAEEFAKLVRKYIPNPSSRRTADDEQLLAMLQDSTSCYSPYVWSSEFDPKERT